jgi:hypothetical protein
MCWTKSRNSICWMRAENCTWEQRTEARKKHADPVLESAKPVQLPPRQLGKAIAYAHCGLSAYVLHGQMEIDNNLVDDIPVCRITQRRRDDRCTPSWPAAKRTTSMSLGSKMSKNPKHQPQRPLPTASLKLERIPTK